MALPSNHVGHYEEERPRSRSLTPRPHKKKRRPITPDPNNEDYYYETDYSTRVPSIIGLENLHEDGGNEKFVVESARETGSFTPVNAGRRTPVNTSRRTPVKTFLPTKHGQMSREKTKVYVTVVMLKIGEIDTIKEYFEADVYIQIRWREPSLDNVKYNVMDFSSYWNPELVVQNVFEDPKTKVWHELRLGDRGDAYIYEMMRVKGKFFETMELNDFPFDIQSISIVLTSELTKDLVRLEEDKNEVSTIHYDCFSDSQEWKLFNFVEVDPMDISSQYSRASKNYSGLIFTSCLSRRYGFFAWNVLAIVVLLTLFAFTTFAVKPSLVQNRLQLSFILVLAVISFRFVTNQSIPKISYLTHLDRYMMIGTMFIGFITLWHAILSRVDSDSLQDTLDFWAFIVFAVAYFLFQLIFIFVMLYERRVKLQEVRGKEDKYKNKACSTMGEIYNIVRDEIGLVTSHLDLRRRSNIHRRPR